MADAKILETHGGRLVIYTQFRAHLIVSRGVADLSLNWVNNTAIYSVREFYSGVSPHSPAACASADDGDDDARSSFTFRATPICSCLPCDRPRIQYFVQRSPSLFSQSNPHTEWHSIALACAAGDALLVVRMRWRHYEFRIFAHFNFAFFLFFF